MGDGPESGGVGMTVLLPTFNRAEVLRLTLDALTHVDQSGIDWELVVIDNDCTDHTRDVVAEYQGRLPLTYLQESRPGKNCALNRALRECPMKEIVVFTDDDVTPNTSWLQEIRSASARWPSVSVFGGRIRVAWPDDREPEWVTARWIREFGFAWHDHGEREVLYEPGAYPFGPNYWVRRSVFEAVPRFDETIGPRPKNRIMGGETAFLLELERRGFKELYCPGAQVTHRIDPRCCTVAGLRRRAYRFGRGEVRLHGLHRQETYAKSKVLWALTLGRDYVDTTTRLCRGLFIRDRRQSCEVTVHAMIQLGALSETIKQIRAGQGVVEGLPGLRR